MEWYYYVILAVMVLITLAVCIKAYKVSKKRNERMREESERLKHDNELKRDFAVLTADRLRCSDDRLLLEGVAMNIQLPLEKQADMISAFNILPEQKQYVYTLEYYYQDTKKTKALSEFFKCNGRPLTVLAPVALRAVGLEALADVTDRMLPMCDDDNEEVSIDCELRSQLDAEFSEVFDDKAYLAAAAAYIRNNERVFVDSVD